MARVKKAYGPNVTLVGKSSSRPTEPISPDNEAKLEALKNSVEHPKKQGLDRVDELKLRSDLNEQEWVNAYAYWNNLAAKREAAAYLREWGG